MTIFEEYLQLTKSKQNIKGTISGCSLLKVILIGI